jgi:hypothetical protein
MGTGMCHRNIFGILLFAIILGITGTAGAECKKAGDDCHFQIGSNECDSDVCKTGLSCSVMTPSKTSSATCQPAKMKPFTLGLGGLIPGGVPFGSSTGGSTCQQKAGQICTESTPCCPGMTCTLVTSGQNVGFKICTYPPPNEQFVYEMTNAFAIPMMALIPFHVHGEKEFYAGSKLYSEFLEAFKTLTTQTLRRYPCLEVNDAFLLNFILNAINYAGNYMANDQADVTPAINGYHDELRAQLDSTSANYSQTLSCVNFQ